MKCTDKLCPDFVAIEKAIRIINEITLKTNEHKRKIDSLARINQLSLKGKSSVNTKLPFFSISTIPTEQILAKIITTWKDFGSRRNCDESRFEEEKGEKELLVSVFRYSADFEACRNSKK